jgi:ABC-type multidrug transport system permease subunit
MKLQRLRSILAARNKEFLRDYSSLGWNFAFPVLVVLGFSFAFSGREQDLFKIAVVAQPDAALSSEFLQIRHIQKVEKQESELQDTLQRLKRHQVDFVLAPAEQGSGLRYWLNETSPKGYLLEKLLLGSVPEAARLQVIKGTVAGKEIRYVDWLISGLLAMNMMFSALFGVGYTIVRYRKTGFLKRLKATPLTPMEFLLAQIFSRLWLLVAVTAIVYTGCHLLVKFTMLGSYFDLFVVLIAGSLCLISLGLVVAAAIRSEEFAGGVLNLLTWPMMFLSGVWFSLEGSPNWVIQVAKVFPLTHVIGAARAIMTEGATLGQVMPHVTALGAMTLVFLVLGSAIFKWE